MKQYLVVVENSSDDLVAHIVKHGLKLGYKINSKYYQSVDDFIVDFNISNKNTICFSITSLIFATAVVNCKEILTPEEFLQIKTLKMDKIMPKKNIYKIGNIFIRKKTDLATTNYTCPFKVNEKIKLIELDKLLARFHGGHLYKKLDNLPTKHAVNAWYCHTDNIKFYCTAEEWEVDPNNTKSDVAYAQEYLSKPTDESKSDDFEKNTWTPTIWTLPIPSDTPRRPTEEPYPALNLVPGHWIPVYKFSPGKQRRLDHTKMISIVNTQDWGEEHLNVIYNKFISDKECMINNQRYIFV